MGQFRTCKECMLSFLLFVSLLFFTLQGVSGCFLGSAEASSPRIAISDIHGICSLLNAEKRDALIPLLADPDVASQDNEPKRQKGHLLF